MHFDWNDSSEARCKALALEGNSATVIAATMTAEYRVKISRNSIIGKIHRAGWPWGGTEERRNNPSGKRLRAERTSPRPLRGRPASLGSFRRKLQEAVQRLDEPSAATQVAPLPEKPPYGLPWANLGPSRPAGSVAFFDLRRRSCRWPLGPFLRRPEFFCGTETLTEAVPYCRDHCAIAYPSLGLIPNPRIEARWRSEQDEAERRSEQDRNGGRELPVEVKAGAMSNAKYRASNAPKPMRQGPRRRRKRAAA